MTCERLRAALVEGRALTPPDTEHLRTCAACARLARALEAPAPVPGAAAGPVPPTAAELTRRVRGQRAREGALALAALALAALAAPALWPAATPEVAPAPLVARSADTGAVEAPDDDPVVEDLDPDELIAASEPASDADEALLAALGHLDHLDDPPAALPDAPLVALLDPFESDPDPLLNLGEL